MDKGLLAIVYDGSKRGPVRLEAAIKVIEGSRKLLHQYQVDNERLRGQSKPAEPGTDWQSLCLSLQQQLALSHGKKEQSQQPVHAIQQRQVEDSQDHANEIDGKRGIEAAEDAFIRFSSRKGILDLTAMQNHLVCPGQMLPQAFHDIATEMELLQVKWFDECWQHRIKTGEYPRRDMGNVVFRVRFVKLEHVGNLVYRNRGDFRVAGGTFIEAEGCSSLKQVCQKVCQEHMEIKDYAELLWALNTRPWSEMQKIFTWRMDNGDSGNWGDEFTWATTYRDELNAMHEPIQDIYVGLVLPQSETLMIGQGHVEEEL